MNSTTSYPKTLLSIVASVGGLALFLLVASTLLVSQPIGAAVRGYFYGVHGTGNPDSFTSSLFESNNTINRFEGVWELNSTVVGVSVIADHGNKSEMSGGIDGEGSLTENTHPPKSLRGDQLFDPGFKESKNSTVELPITGVLPNDGEITSSSLVNATVNPQVTPSNSSKGIADLSEDDIVGSGCDLYNGKWIYDSTGPLYTNNSCPVITQMQNCQGNGRPDKDYEYWRWKPSQCDLPRFDPKKFLELMRGKTIAFIGDSVARNQMESMLCILWQVEVPKNRGNKRMHRYYFRSTSTMIVRLWSSWLVHQTSDPFDYAPAGVAKVHLDVPDETFMQDIVSFDVIVLSSGHWFAKQSVYILNNEIVGGQLWRPKKSMKPTIGNIEAFRISVETILTAMGTHPNYTGLTIVRSFSPDHYEGGGWNTGGSCTGKVKPASDGELVDNGFTNIMHEKQALGFDRALKKKTNKSKMKFMDITKVFSYRQDGHPGPYRNLDPNKKTSRGRDGKPPPQDCLHWCMPGPVDTWNELVFEILRREYSGRQSNMS